MFSEAAVTAVMKSASNRGFSKVTGKLRMVGEVRLFHWFVVTKTLATIEYSSLILTMKFLRFYVKVEPIISISNGLI